MRIDATKISEADRVDLTTPQVCRQWGLTTTGTNFACDASEVVFTNGHSCGIAASAIRDVYTLASNRLGCDNTTKQWHDRTKHRRPLARMVTAASEEKTKSFKNWSREFLNVREKEMGGVTALEILQEGASTIVSFKKTRNPCIRIAS